MNIKFDAGKKIVCISDEEDVYEFPVLPDSSGNWVIKDIWNPTQEKEYVVARNPDLAELLLYQIQDEFECANLIRFTGQFFYSTVSKKYLFDTVEELIEYKEITEEHEEVKLWYSPQAKIFACEKTTEYWDTIHAGFVYTKEKTSLPNFVKRLNAYFNNEVYEKIFPCGKTELLISTNSDS